MSLGKIVLKKIIKKYWFWLVIFLIFIGQLTFTIKSSNKIRLEEIAESVRNVWWLQNRTIYDGISSNVGWYGTLLVLYNIFGFFLFEAKIYRLIIHLISLLCIASILKKYIGEKKAVLPLIAWGLSPTLLYLNTLQASFGIDLQYFPICLYVILNLNFLHSLKTIIKEIFLWSFVMIGCMSYPTFLAYVPILAIFYIVILKRQTKTDKLFKFLGNILISLFSFCLPMIIILNYLREPQLLIYDPRVKSGIFRGGGGAEIAKSIPILLKNTLNGSKQVFRDLFLDPSSFYFEHNIIRSEFSHKILFWAVLIILVASIWFFIKVKQVRFVVGISWLLISISLFLGNFTGTLPGIRRSSGVLIGFYVLYCIVWRFLKRRNLFNNNLLVGLVTICLFLIPLHHTKVFPNNIAAFSFGTPHAADGCYNFFPNYPVESLNYFVDKIRVGQKINNFNFGKKDFVCRLHSLYAGTAGTCYWNRLNCPPVWGFDENNPGNFINLSTKLWENYYFNH